MAYLPPVPATTLHPLVRLLFALTRAVLGRLPASTQGQAHSPRVLFGISLGHVLFCEPRSIPADLEALAHLRAASLVGCRFCIDVGAKVALDTGLSRDTLLQLPQWEDSAAFGEDQRLVLAWTDALSTTPAQPSADLAQQLRARFGDRGLVELSASIGFEHQRARLNHALGYTDEGFTEDMVCQLAPPEPT